MKKLKKNQKYSELKGELGSIAENLETDKNNKIESIEMILTSVKNSKDFNKDIKKCMMRCVNL